MVEVLEHLPDYLHRWTALQRAGWDRGKAERWLHAHDYAAPTRTRRAGS